MSSDRDLDRVGRFVAALAPADPSAAAAMDLAPFADTVAELGTEPVRWAIELADGLTGGGVVSRSPEAPTREIARATRANAVGLLRAVAGCGGQVALPPERRVIVRAAVRQAIPFAGLVRGFRALQHQWAAQISQHIESYQPAQDRPVLRARVLDAIPAFFDANIDAVITEYLTERERLLAGHVVERGELIDRLLRGEPVDEAGADQVLGVPLGAHHLAAVLSSDRLAPQELQAATARITAAASRTLRCTGSVELLGPDGSRWIWLTRPAPFPSDYAAAFAAAPSGPRVALGRPAAGAEGFRRSHLCALAVARSGGRSWDADALPALLTSDAEAAMWFVQEELAGLAGPGADLAELRRTVCRYFDLGSVVAVAADLHIHRNTVIYRFKRIEGLLGHPLSERRVQVWAALLLAEQCETR